VAKRRRRLARDPAQVAVVGADQVLHRRVDRAERAGRGQLELLRRQLQAAIQEQERRPRVVAEDRPQVIRRPRCHRTYTRPSVSRRKCSPPLSSITSRPWAPRTEPIWARCSSPWWTAWVSSRALAWGISG